MKLYINYVFVTTKEKRITEWEFSSIDERPTHAAHPYFSESFQMIFFSSIPGP
jgi:hypothetical protein